MRNLARAVYQIAEKSIVQHRKAEVIAGAMQDREYLVGLGGHGTHSSVLENAN